MENHPISEVYKKKKIPTDSLIQRRNDTRAFRIFYENIKSPVTKKLYVKHLDLFLNYLKAKEYEDILALPDKQIQRLVEDYVLELKKRDDLSPNSIPIMLGGVQHFLVMNDKIVNWKKINKFFPEKIQSTGKKAWATKDVQKMLGVCTTLRAKAILLTLTSTGMRARAITELKVGDVTEWRKSGKFGETTATGCKKVVIYAGAKEQYIGFLTPETSQALDEYLDKRHADGENMNTNSPLFRNTYGKETVNKVKPLDYYYIRELFTTTSKKAGIVRKKESDKRYEIQNVHGFRKRYNTILKNNSKINSNIAEKLLGHKKGLDGVYFVPTEEELFTEFEKAIDDLVIDDKARLKSKNERLELENLESKAKDVKLEKALKKMDEISEELEKVKKRVQWSEKAKKKK